MEAAGDFLARYADGEVAAKCATSSAGSTPDVGARAQLGIVELETRRALASWPVAESFPAHGRRGELRIARGGLSTGARVVVAEPAEVARANAGPVAEASPDRRRRERRQQGRMIGLSTLAVACLIVAYIYGVPLLASRIVNFVPPAWEKRIGDTVAVQMQAALSKNGGFAVCDPDPNSVANLAINRFANAALAGTGTPFTADVTVIRTDIPNAFSLPGGKAFFFSGLLVHTETPDEFAGVLAHEMGHVVHRDGMQQLISGASTGLLIGFLLGDMTGLSVAGGLGTTLVNTQFSREAEANADLFAAQTAQRLRFQPVGLANLLERVASDDSFTQAMAFLNTHPLTAKRRAALEALRPTDDPSLPPAFTDSEWQAIKNMCGPPAATAAPSAPASPAPGTGSNEPSPTTNAHSTEDDGAGGRAHIKIAPRV